MEVQFGQTESTEGTATAKPARRRGGRVATGGMWKERHDQILALPIAANVADATWMTVDFETENRLTYFIAATYKWQKQLAATDWRVKMEKVSATQVRVCRVVPTVLRPAVAVFGEILALPVSEKAEDAQWARIDCGDKQKSNNLVQAVYRWAKLKNEDWKVRVKRESESVLLFARLARATVCPEAAAETPGTAPDAPCVNEAAPTCTEAPNVPCESSCGSAEASNPDPTADEPVCSEPERE